MLDILQIAAAALTILTGLVSLFWPQRVLGFTGLQVVGGRGITEVRTILGALFVGLGAVVLVFNSDQAYQVLGYTYLVMAVVRGVSIFADDSRTSSNLTSFAAEAVLGILLVL